MIRQTLFLFLYVEVVAVLMEVFSVIGVDARDPLLILSNDVFVVLDVIDEDVVIVAVVRVTGVDDAATVAPVLVSNFGESKEPLILACSL